MAVFLNEDWSGYLAIDDTDWVVDAGTDVDFNLIDQDGDPVFDDFDQCLFMENAASTAPKAHLPFGHAYRPTEIDITWGVERQDTQRVPAFQFTNYDNEHLLAFIPANSDAASATNNIYINGVDTGIQNPTQKVYRMVVNNIDYGAQTYDIEIWEDGISVYTDTGASFHSSWNDGAVDRLIFLGASGESGSQGRTYLDQITLTGDEYLSVALVSLDDSDSRYTWTKAELEEYGFQVTTILDAVWDEYDFSGYDMVMLCRSLLSQANHLSIRAAGVPVLAAGLNAGQRMRAATTTSFVNDGADVEVFNDTHDIWVALGKSNGDELSRPIWFAEFVDDGETAAGTILSKSNANLQGAGGVETWEIVANLGEDDVDGDPFEARFAWLGWWYPSSNPHTAPFLELRPHLQDVIDWLLEPPGTQPGTPSCSVASKSTTNVDLTSSAFNDPGDTHAASQWQVDVTAGDFSSPVVDSGEDATNLVSYSSPASLSAGTGYKARVRHKDGEGVWSAWSTAAAFTTRDVPAQPTVNASPAGTSVNLTSSAFSEPDGDSHLASQWQVDVTAGDFSSPVVDSGEDTANLVAFTGSGLAEGTGYKARVRHKDVDGWSAWSSSQSFTSGVPPATPTIGVGAVTSSTVALSGSAFSDADAGETHAASQWQVDLDENDFSDPEYNVTSSADLEAHTATGLRSSTQYKARVRYQDNTGLWSEWSTASSFFTTAESFVADCITATERFVADCITATERFTECAAPDSTVFEEETFG